MYLKSSWTQTHSSMKRKKSREIIFPLKLYKASRSLLLKNWSDIVSAPDTTIYWSGNKYLFRILIAPLSNENLLPSVEVIAYVFHRKGNQRFSYRHVYEKLNTANITLVATCACFVTEPWQVCHLNWVTEVVLIHIYIYIYKILHCSSIMWKMEEIKSKCIYLRGLDLSNRCLISEKLPVQ